MVSSAIVRPIFKKVLLSGLTILVRPVDNVPKVSIQLRYPVGSKDEESSEKGLAHLIEHMIFKGTKELLSETDISALTQKLSGYANAFTSYDYTGYVFDFPSHHWQEALPILADCMRNGRFDEQMLNSELKAVIQELKMGRDNYMRALWQYMMAAIFYDHPYHYPVIGFKQDLWNMTRDGLFEFYQKHYVPNNAVLVVVGDVDLEEVFALAEKTLGQIPADPNYSKKEYYHGHELAAQSVTLYRDIQQPYGVFAFVLPGLKEKKQYEIDVLSTILCNGKSSRLSKILVDELQLITQLAGYSLSLEDATLYMIYFCAKSEDSFEQIRSIITQEIQNLITNGCTDEEVALAVRKVKVGLISMLEYNSSQANTIAQDFLMTGDGNYTFKMISKDATGLKDDIQSLLVNYFRVSSMHSGRVLPLTEEGREQWKKLQLLSDEEDARILGGRIREIPIEPILYTEKVAIKKAEKFHFPKPKKYELSNGVKVLEHATTNIPKIDIMISLGAQSYYEPEETPGIYTFVSQMLSEGTKKYPGSSFAKEAESYGIALNVFAGTIIVSVLKEDLEKGLELVQEVLMYASFDKDVVEKIRHKVQAQAKMNLDNPGLQAGLLVRKHIYKDHPYGKNTLGTSENFASMTQEDLVDFYKKYITPDGARVAIVGDLQGIDTYALLEKYLGVWTGPKLPKLEYCKLQPAKDELIHSYMNRDQIVLLFAGLSVPRLHPDFYKLQLFDQIFGGGSMNSRLFKLRERSGLFYSATGSLVAGSDEQPGMVMVQTMVSQDRLEEAKVAIKKTMEEVVDTLTEQELVTAKEVLINNQINSFAANMSIAGIFLQIDKFNLPENHFDNRISQINAITLDEVKEAARKVLIPSQMLTLQVGRV